MTTDGPGEAGRKLDLSTYRTDELAEQVSDLISVPRRLRTILVCCLASLLVVCLAVGLVFGPRVHWGTLLGLMIYGAIAALVCGGLLALLLLLNQALQNIIEVFGLSVHISEQVAEDMRRFQSGELFPSSPELLDAVHDQVILPVVERVIRSQVGFLSGILFPLYRASIGRVTRYALKAARAWKSEDADQVSRSAPDRETDVVAEVADIAPAEPSDRDASALCDTAVAPNAVARRLSSTKTFLKRALELASRHGDRLRRMVIVPLAVLLTIALLVALLPLLIALIVVLWQ